MKEDLDHQVLAAYRSSEVAAGTAGKAKGRRKQKVGEQA